VWLLSRRRRFLDEKAAVQCARQRGLKWRRNVQKLQSIMRL